MFDFSERINKILEAVEDEENIDIDDDLYRDEDYEDEDEKKAEEEESLMSRMGIDDDDVESMPIDSLAGIARAPAGKQLDDMKAQKVMGPPMLWKDGELVPADPTLVIDEQGEFANPPMKNGKIFPGGVVTPIKWNNFEDGVKQKYVPIDLEGNAFSISDLPLVNGELPLEQGKGKKWEVQYPPHYDGPVISHFEKASRGSMDREFLIPSNISDEELESGNFEKWYFDDVVRALLDYAKGIARKIETPTYSRQEGITDALSAITQAWLTDLGKSPFHNHAYKTMEAAVKDSANRARNVSGEKTSTGSGVRQWASAYKGAVSADAPIGNSEEGGSANISSTLSGKIEGAEEAARQGKMNELVMSLASIEEIGLSPKEKNVLFYSYGINPKTGETLEWKDDEGNQQSGPIPLSILAKRGKTPVSNARMSQIRNSAMRKLSIFVNDAGLDTVERAFEKFGLEEAKAVASCVLQTLIEFAKIELDMILETKEIPITASVNGINREVIVHVNSSDFSVSNVMCEGDSIYGQVGGSAINEAKCRARAMSRISYFTEMASMVAGIYAQPVLGVIGVKAESDEEDEVEDKE